MADSIQFSGDNRTVHSFDGQVLNKGVQNPNAMSDSAKAGINIATRSGGLHTFNSHSGITEVAPSTTTVQLQAPTGRVAILGTTVAPEVYEKMKETSPELFLPEAEKVAEVAKVEKSAAQEAADLVDLNRFADDAAEGVAMHIKNDVQFGDQVRVLHELHTTGTVSTATLNRVADQMHMSVPDAVDALNAVATNTSFQLAALCKASGVDAQAFSTYMKTHQSTDMFKAIQVHSQERDMVRAWSGHIASFKARGGK